MCALTDKASAHILGNPGNVVVKTIVRQASAPQDRARRKVGAVILRLEIDDVGADGIGLRYDHGVEILGIIFKEKHRNALIVPGDPGKKPCMGRATKLDVQPIDLVAGYAAEHQAEVANNCHFTNSIEDESSLRIEAFLLTKNTGVGAS